MSQTQAQAILHSAADGILTTHEDGTIQSVNPAAVKIFGYSAEEMLGQKVGLLMPEPYRSRNDWYVTQYRSDKTEPSTSVAREVMGRRKDGTTFPLEVTLSEARVSERTVFIAIVRDITGRKHVEEARLRGERQIRELRKLEAIGELASGVAHDFSNLLTVISASTEALDRSLKHDNAAYTEIAQIQHAVEQAKWVTNSLLTFSRKAPSGKIPVNLRGIVDKTATLLQRTLIPRSIELVLDQEDEPAIWVYANETQLQQVLLNLAINARDSMGSTGTLRISVSLSTEDPVDSSRVRSEQDEDRRFARVTVADTGSGIPTEIRSRIFEPFFTTKARGQGTGLGLSIIHGIIKDHDGHIDVESEADNGSSFSVYLPCVSPPTALQEDRLSDIVSKGRSGLVLLAEGQEQVRAALASTLESLGYEVLQAGDGASFKERFAQQGREIQLLVVDTDLLGQGGPACLADLRSGDTDTPAVLITGNVVDTFDGVLADRDVLLRKPFQMSEFTKTVTTILAHPRPQGVSR